VFVKFSLFQDGTREPPLQIYVSLGARVCGTLCTPGFCGIACKLLNTTFRTEHEMITETLDRILLETVLSFTYLESKITSDGKSHTDIVCRIAQTNQAYYKKRILFTSNRIFLDTRKTLTKSFVWSVALYGAETWTIMNAEKAKIEAFEVW
jgi:hypothetical protein